MIDAIDALLNACWCLLIITMAFVAVAVFDNGGAGQIIRAAFHHFTR